MTNKTKEQLIYENWRKFLEEDLSEVSVYKYTGQTINPDDPEALQVWDPETIEKTPTGKFALTGSDIEPLVTGSFDLSDVFKFLKGAGIAGLAGVGALKASSMLGDIVTSVGDRRNLIKLGKELKKQGIDPRKDPKGARDIARKIGQRGLLSRLVRLAGRGGRLLGIPGLMYLAYKAATEDDEQADSEPSKVAAMPHTADDEDALMRMLHAETSWAKPLDEMAAIVQVAFNRKESWNRKDFSSVVRPRTSGWNDGSSGYERNYNNADRYYDKPRANKARDLIKRMLQGERPVGNLGGALNWLHAGKMPKCDAEHGTKITRTTQKGKIRISYCFDYGTIGMPFGKRRVPTWAIQRGNKTGQLPGGSSKSKPRMVGRMVYSNGSLIATRTKPTTKNNKTSKDLPIIPGSKVNNPKLRVAVIGDSIMAGSYGAGGKLKNILEKENIRVDNLAVGGRTMVKIGKKQNDQTNGKQSREKIKNQNLIFL
jgi:hypothetical protein